jgi:hypothetical protein
VRKTKPASAGKCIVVAVACAAIATEPVLAHAIARILKTEKILVGRGAIF